MNAITKVKAASATRRGLIIGASVVGGALVVGCSPKSMAGLMSMGSGDLDIGAFGPFIKIDPAAEAARRVLRRYESSVTDSVAPSAI